MAGVCRRNRRNIKMKEKSDIQEEIAETLGVPKKWIEDLEED